jgi:peptidoglycan/xylan/chitin deacetylase (PgdA/CDA1 family)
MTQPHTPRNTSLPLIALALIVGVALGWLLHDLFGRAQPAPATAVPTSVAPTTPAPAAEPGTGGSQTRPDAPTVAPPTEAPVAPTATSGTGGSQTRPDAPTAAPTEAPPTAPAPTAAPVEPTSAPAGAITGYAGHVVAEGETLSSIAASGGSTAELIARYHRLDGEPQPGRALIVPRLEGQASALESQPLLVQRGPADKPWVALTLDAGASAEPVPQILKTLREHNVKITFFLTGKWIKDNPELTRQIVAEGHEIANHTFNHPDLRDLGDEAIHKELADTEALLEQTAGASSRPLFRPPYGAYDERVLRRLVGEGYLPIYWTLDSLDSVGEPKTADFLFERVTGKLTPDKLRGAIILAHCGSQPTADALPRILDRFAEMGFEVKKVSEVLAG